MGSVGSHVGPASSSPCASSRGSSDACSWKSWSSPTTPAASTSSAITRRSPSAIPSPRIWCLYAKPTHRVAIANSRLVALDDAGVTFRWKDYRAKEHERAKLMTLAIDEFIRRFLIHVLPG